METLARPVAAAPDRTGEGIGAERRPDPAALREAIRRVVRAVSDDVIPGAVVGVADSLGVLALDVIRGSRTARLQPDGLFFLASVTKPIVATAVMRLVDRGQVDLDEPVRRWVPAFQGGGKDRVTVRHVLSHTGGIEDHDHDVIRRERPSAARMLELVCRSPLRFEPGTRYEYGSSSFYLLSELIAMTVGRPFPDALLELVTGPAGMTDTSFDPRHDRRRIVVVEGIPLGNRIVRELVLRFLVRATLPGGGLWGTATDLLRFGQLLLPAATAAGTGLLSAAALAEMTREQTTGLVEVSADGTERKPRYALGWAKPRSDDDWDSPPTAAGGRDGFGVGVPASPRAFTHGGAAGTRLWIDPDRDLVFVFLTNRWGADDAPMFDALREVVRVFDAQR